MSLYALSSDRKEPIYIQIANHLEGEISRNFQAGDNLPSEGELAARFGVNRHTLRRAIDELVNKGLVERRHGRGVFVLEGHLNYHLGAGTRFTETLSAKGHATTSRIVRMQRIIPSERVTERLSLPAGTPVFWIETLRTVDGKPLCVISHFLDADRFPALATDYQEGSLHKFLRETYGCELRRSESFITAILPQGDDARLLEMPASRPVLRVKSINIDERDGRPVEYAISRLRGDGVELNVNL
ncbi:MAG: phosphonate metabolism transcriptional regulator PhnF [Marinobacter sp.]|nr:phosphonate metabolism transcriptional regulator PhnF [Marinobacter sp.]